MTRLAGLLLALVSLMGCAAPIHPLVPHVPAGAPTTATQVTRTGVLIVPASNHVTGLPYPTHCVAQGKLPDPVCTPGAIRSDVDPNHLELTVCKKDWSTSVRPPKAETDALKTTAMTAYGVPPALRGRTELDHKIPEALGGASDTKNLWPQVSDLKGQGFRNSKDTVEEKIHAAVCRKAAPVPWRDAVLAFAQDWTTAERKLGVQ